MTDVMDKIREKFGEESIMKLSECTRNMDVISTGSVSLDMALGVKGFPKGRIVEVYGPESSGKTTLALSTIAEAQKLGLKAAFIDAEHALDSDYAAKLGVNINELLLSQPSCGEEALDIVELLVKSDEVGVIVIDSVAALVPKAEIEGNMGDSHMGLQARLMSQAMRKLTGAIAKSDALVIFLNQTRQKIGIVFGNPETTTGGMALKFYSSIRIEIRRAAQLKKDEAIIGNLVKLKVVKNKVAPPFKTCEFEIIYAEGISKNGDILEAGLTCEVVRKEGNTYYWKDVKLGVGREKAKEGVTPHYDNIRSEILNKKHE